MPTRIEMLKQAGFSDAEIGDWATAERQRMHDAGFTNDEIDEEFGVTRPPRDVPMAYIERLKQGNAFQRVAGAAGEYAQDYFGEEPLGFSPRSQEFLHKLGAVGEAIIPVAKPVDAALRAVPAGIAALGAGLGQAVEEAQAATFGPGAGAYGKAARDFAQLAQIGALLSGASRSAARIAPAPRLAGGPAIVLPRAEDFRNAAAVISGMPTSFPAEQKLLRLWTEHGILPAEVALDAMRDRTIAADLRSDSEKLPDAYVGTGNKAPAAGRETAAPAQAITFVQDDRTAPGAESQPGATKAADRPVDEPSGTAPVRMTAQSRDVGMYAPPRIWQRPFNFDYRTPPPTTSDGRLLSDMEGRPLRATFVAGRRYAGMPDRPLSPDDIKTALAPLDIRLITAENMPAQDDAIIGLYRGFRKRHRPTGDIYVKSTLSPEDQAMTIAHEFGHALDHYAGTLSKSLTDAEVEELRRVYSTVRAGPKKTPRLQPEDFGYEPRAVNRELLAEGFRAYLTNPNYFKAAAPRTARKIRAAINENPDLKHIIQFNSLGAAGLIGAGLIGTGPGGQDQDAQ